MKKILFSIITIGILVFCFFNNADKLRIQQSSPFPEIKNHLNTYDTINYDTQKAIWISYIEISEILPKGKSEFHKIFSQMCKNISEDGFNTIYVHVRAFGDAVYPSEFYSFSNFFKNCKPYDALEIMINDAHKYKLSFHAWINPLRCDTQENMSNMSNSKYNITKWYNNKDKYPEYIQYVDDNGYYWLNAGIQEVRDFIADGAKEIAEKYKVDGINIDDYFYPTDQSYFDLETYKKSGMEESLKQWRLNNISEMVSQMYSEIKKVNSNILFGISPQGNIENNYEHMCADVKLWFEENGYADYIAPQIYFGYENDTKPFIDTINEWISISKNSSVNLIIGIGGYKIDNEKEFIENIGIIANQISDSLYLSNGAAVYSYSSLYSDDSERRVKEREMIKKILKNI